MATVHAQTNREQALRVLQAGHRRDVSHTATEAAVRMIRVDRAYASSTSETVLFSSEEAVNLDQLSLFPAGKRLLIVRRGGSFEIYDIASKRVVSQVVHTPPPDSHRLMTRVKICPTSIRSGYLVVKLTGMLPIHKSKWLS